MNTTQAALNPLAMLQQLATQMPQMQQNYGNALNAYTQQSQQANDELIKMLQAQQGGGMSSPLFQLGAALLSPTRTGSFGESMGMGAAAFDKANTANRNDLIDRAIKINTLRQASAKFGLDAAQAQMGMMKDQIGLASTADDLMTKARTQERSSQQRAQYLQAIESMPDLQPHERNLLRTMDPAEGVKYLNERSKLDGTDKKAILDKGDDAKSQEDSAKALKGILEPQRDKQGNVIPNSSLNERANSGFAASTRAAIGRNLPTFLTESNIGKAIGLDEQSRVATTSLDATVRTQMLPMIKMLGSNPSVYDAQLIERIQALSDKSPAEREAIIKEATARAQQKARELRAEQEAIKNKSIYRPGSPQQPAQPTGPQEGQTATNPTTKERIIFRNGQWVPL